MEVLEIEGEEEREGVEQNKEEEPQPRSKVHDHGLDSFTTACGIYHGQPVVCSASAPSENFSTSFFLAATPRAVVLGMPCPWCSNFVDFSWPFTTARALWHGQTVVPVVSIAPLFFSKIRMKEYIKLGLPTKNRFFKVISLTFDFICASDQKGSRL